MKVAYGKIVLAVFVFSTQAEEDSEERQTSMTDS